MAVAYHVIILLLVSKKVTLVMSIMETKKASNGNSRSAKSLLPNNWILNFSIHKNKIGATCELSKGFVKPR